MKEWNEKRKQQQNKTIANQNNGTNGGLSIASPAFSFSSKSIQKKKNLAENAQGKEGEAPLHDYFDSDGNFIGSDSRGDEIRIVRNENLEKANKLDGDEKYKFLSENSDKFSEFQFTGKGEAAGKIGQHYLNEYVSCNEVEVCGKVNASFNYAAMTFKKKIRKGNLIYSKEPAVIQIPLSGYGKAYNNTLDNKYNFINILYHELMHFDDVGFDGEYYYYHLTTKEVGDSGINIHLAVYLEQSNHPSYKNTTPTFKSKNNGFIKGYIKALENPVSKTFWNNAFGF